MPVPLEHSVWSRLWSLTSKTFSALPSHMLNICDKFHSNPSAKFGDIESCKTGVNGRMDRRTVLLWPIVCVAVWSAEHWRKDGGNCTALYLYFMSSAWVWITMGHATKPICVAFSHHAGWAQINWQHGWSMVQASFQNMGGSTDDRVSPGAFKSECNDLKRSCIL